MTDLHLISTRRLMAEAQRRAPRCANCGIGMLVTSAWYRCPGCSYIEDFPGNEEYSNATVEEMVSNLTKLGDWIMLGAEDPDDAAAQVGVSTITVIVYLLGQLQSTLGYLERVRGT